MNKTSWKEHPVIKNHDGTFTVTHTSSAGTHPYHVCGKDVDPANIYSVAEVSLFWKSLESSDPRKRTAPDILNEQDT